MPTNVIHCTGNVGRFTPGTAGHNVLVRPFFALPAGGGIPLFNDAYAFLLFRIAAKLPSFSHVLVPGV